MRVRFWLGVTIIVGLFLIIGAILEVTQGDNRTTGDRCTGLVVQDMTQTLAKQMNVKFAPGILVQQMADQQPASSNSLKPGDVITGIDGESVVSVARFNKLLKSNVGVTHQVSLLRNVEVLTLTIKPCISVDSSTDEQRKILFVLGLEAM